MDKIYRGYIKDYICVKKQTSVRQCKPRFLVMIFVEVGETETNNKNSNCVTRCSNSIVTKWWFSTRSPFMVRPRDMMTVLHKLHDTCWTNGRYRTESKKYNGKKHSVSSYITGVEVPGRESGEDEEETNVAEAEEEPEEGTSKKTIKVILGKQGGSIGTQDWRKTMERSRGPRTRGGEKGVHGRPEGSGARNISEKGELARA